MCVLAASDLDSMLVKGKDGAGSYFCGEYFNVRRKSQHCPLLLPQNTSSQSSTKLLTGAAKAPCGP